MVINAFLSTLLGRGFNSRRLHCRGVEGFGSSQLAKAGGAVTEILSATNLRVGDVPAIDGVEGTLGFDGFRKGLAFARHGTAVIGLLK